MSGESWWLICVLPGWRIWRNSSHNCVPILLDKTVPVFMLLRWMCKGLGALIFPFCDQVIYFESFETQKIICHHFCFGGDESGDHRTSAYSAPMPFWTSKLMVWGVILLIILDLSFGFWSYFLAKQAIKIFSNQQLLEYWPPKNHQFRGQKRYGGQKNSLGSQ